MNRVLPGRFLIVCLAMFIGVARADLFTYSGPAVAIPDDDPAGVALSINVTSPIYINELIGVSVTFGPGHTRVGDLRLELVHVPSGAAVELINRPGVRPGSIFGDDSDLVGTYTFSSFIPSSDPLRPRIIDAAALVGSTGLIAEGVYEPTSNDFTGDGAPNFSGETINSPAIFSKLHAVGLWELRAFDLAPGEGGTISNFRFEVSRASVPEPGALGLANLGVLGAVGICRLRRRRIAGT